MQELVGPGEPLLLYHAGKAWLIRVRPGGELHTHLGVVRHEELLGRRYGEAVRTSKGRELYLIRPTIRDLALKFRRVTQVLYPKEWGFIASYLGIAAGSRILEVGTGSGVFSAYLAHLVKPTGRVISYERRKEFYEVALRNLQEVGLLEYVDLRNEDPGRGLGETGLDGAVVDVGDPWLLLDVLPPALKPTAPLAFCVPTFNQVERLVMELRRKGYLTIEAHELLDRRLEVKEGATRPASRMVGHTTFVVFCRSPAPSPNRAA
ncbi:MAG: tRNA methyltransferase [Nitrososphaerota archaeon]